MCDGMLLFDELFYSSLPCLLLWLSYMWFFSLCDDHQFIDMSRYERCSRSTAKRWLCCLAIGTRLIHSRLFFRATTHVFGCFLISQFYYCWIVVSVSFGHRGVSWLLYEVKIVLPAFIYYLCVTFTLIIFID